jgi:hypothetical protein
MDGSGARTDATSDGGTGEHVDLLDRIDALRVLRAETPEEKGRLLEEIGGHGKVEQDIVSQLSKVRPLWRPDQFEQSHRLVMRSLEVLDRNGARPAKLPPLGFLQPVASYVVQQMTRWIVKGYQNSLIGSIRKLYERREANSAWGSADHVMLRRARINAVQVEQGLRGNPLGLPTFLLGGAFLSLIVSGVRGLIDLAFRDRVASVIIFALTALLLLGLSWAAIYSAAVARRRIRLATEQPVRALYDIVGAAGDPPRDQSYNFSVYAIVLIVLAFLVVPVIVWRVIL